MGSPAAIVTPLGELLITGSVAQTQISQTSDILVGNDQTQLLTEIVGLLKINNLIILIIKVETLETIMLGVEGLAITGSL